MQAPEPLDADEIQRLQTWQQRMMRFHAIAVPTLLLAAGAAFYWSDLIWLRRSTLVLLLVLVAAATMLQLSERCPRCRARLRTTSLLRLPRRCNFCGVPFPSSENAAGPAPGSSS